jgi:EpsI family protein
MTELKIILVPVFLAAQALFVHWTGSLERPPAKPDFARFPVRLGPWERLREDPVGAETAAQLRADGLVSSTYIERPGGRMASLFLAWFQSQRAGTSQPHSPQVCLPAAGWTPESTGLIAIGPITVNRYVVVKGPDRAVVLYWYQTPRRAVAGEWAAKFWLLPDALRDRRTDTALVRVTGADESAATRFAERLYPVLREIFALP